LAPRGPDEDLAAFLARALDAHLPDPDSRARALRTARARLGYPLPGVPPALRVETRAALDRLQGTPAADPTPAAPTGDTLAEPTTRAGLVLFHPFLVLLFQRLDLLDDARRLRPDALLMARAALRALADGAPDPARPTDPVERALLGLPPGWTHPGGPDPDPPDPGLLDSLTRAVIDRWGALGQTAPEGLRETFVRRAGTLSETETGPRLAVDPGPYDMLLDRLPWSLSTVALPWMALPLAVEWR
ncbi:MAG: contractile injection system tape measure protein, partial [Rhodovulum sp.]